MLIKCLKQIFTFQKLVTRSEYLSYGFSLMLLKYLGEAVMFYLLRNEYLSISQFFNPLLSSRMAPPLAESGIYAPQEYLIVWLHVFWSLPFVWAGFSLSARRALDAGCGTAIAFIFFVPFVNFFMMAFLSIMPSTKQEDALVQDHKKSALLFKEAFIVGSLSALCCVAVIAFFVYFFSSYSAALFVGVPFIHGFIITAALNRQSRRKFSESFRVIFISLLFAGGLLLVFAMEGMICILMASPIWLLFSALGSRVADGLCGRWKIQNSGPTQLYSLILLPLIFEPVAMLSESGIPAAEPLREVTTVVEIDASPQEVWPHVVQFSELPPPEEWIFRLGVAYPIRATINGSGVGAIRYCQFSTGDFVEPITEWDEPRQLSFDVQYQPRPLKELSPYSDVHAPHLDNFLQSRHGQFRLIALPGGRTRLEGRTWYTLKIMPVLYWGLFSDNFIHSIHIRVLNHIKAETEASVS